MKVQKVQWLQVSFLLVAVSLFWSLRISYWATTEEQPFSDMANFDNVAHKIVSSWNFEWSPFWKTYTTPSLVTARALQIFLFGDSMLAWQIFQAVLTFSALLWLAYELAKATGSLWLAIVLLLVVSLSKSSVFWSLKLSREGFHELLIYAQIAGFLLAYRIQSLRAFFLVGIISAISFLNKPNAILVLPVLLLMITFIYWQGNHFKTVFRPMSRALLSFMIGVAALWGPWIARSVIIYGKPVLLSTQGPYTWLWELGNIKVHLDNGNTVRTNVNNLQKSASLDFPTDLAAAQYANRILKAWLRENFNQVPRLMMDRIRRSLYDRQIYLTKVSRQQLFGNIADKLLLDKSILNIYLGITGLILLAALYRNWALLVMPAAVLIPWLSAAMIVGEARMLEASLPLIIFADFAWLILIYRILVKMSVFKNDTTRNLTNLQ